MDWEWEHQFTNKTWDEDNEQLNRQNIKKIIHVEKLQLYIGTKPRAIYAPPYSSNGVFGGLDNPERPLSPLSWPFVGWFIWGNTYVTTD